jgi:HAMP domain-containing protein
MEKYLTPLQYQQYLHDKAYQAAVAQSFPTTTQVFIAAGIFIVAVIIWAVHGRIRDNRRRAKELAREVAAHTNTIKVTLPSPAVVAKNEKQWRRAGGGSR